MSNKRIKRVFVLAILLMYGFFARAQLDTIRIGEIRSSVPIIGKLADLQYVFDGKGEWGYSILNFELKNLQN